MKRAVSFVLVLLILLACSSCSYVFSSLISVELTGEVGGASGEPISNAKILVYDSESSRNSDYRKALEIYQRGSYQEMENRSQFQGYTSSSGRISSMSVVWKTSSSAYGEDKDVHTFYFLVLKDGYRPAVTDFKVTSGSGSLGSNSVMITGLEGIYENESIISGTVIEVIDGSDKHLVDNATLYLYPSGYTDFNNIVTDAENLFKENPESYADAIDPGNYHGKTNSEVDGRFSVKAMWSENNNNFSLLIVADGYEPQSRSVSCSDGSTKLGDITLTPYKAEEEAE